MTLDTGYPAPTPRMLIGHTGNVGIGTLIPAEKLDVAGSVKANSFIGDGAQLTNVSGTDVTKVAKSGDTMSGPLNVFKNHNDRTLVTVENSDTGGSSFAAVRVKSTNNAYFGINSPNYSFGNGMGSDRAFVYGDGAGVSLRAVAAGGNILFGAGGDVERMRITNTGSVGIGTASPAEKLEVSGNVKVTKNANEGTTLTVENTNTGPQSYAAMIAKSGTSTSYFGSNSLNYAGGLGSDRGYIFNDGTGVALRAGAPGGNIIFAAGGDVERMRITNTGSVGIGTASPVEKLEVSGNVKVTKNANEGTTLTVENTNTGPQSYAAMIVKSGTSTSYFGSNSLNYAGGLGSDRGYIFNDGTGVALRAGAPGGNIIFAAGGDIERMRLTNGGSLGIGMINPTQKLDVAGNVRATGFIGDGSLLTNVSGTDNTKVLKSGDTMTGMLNLPSNGLSVGGNQLNVVGGNVGIGIATPLHRLDVTGNSVDGTVRITNTATSGASYGLWTSSASPSAFAIAGWATSLTGGTKGVYGRTDSPAGLGVFGHALYGGTGVYGQADTPTGTAVHGLGWASSGVNYGVRGGTNSPNGYAGYFEGRVYAAGNVGVGILIPSEKLDVAGSVRVSNQLISNVAIGTAPLAVNSTTKVTNLNADSLDGMDSTAFAPATGGAYVDLISDQSVAGKKTFTGDLTVAGAKLVVSGGAFTVEPRPSNTGTNNLFVGAGVGAANTSGSGNTVNGAYSLQFNTTGNNNTVSGYLTLQSNTTGVNNTASGAEALRLNTSGDGNTASGYQALYGNTTGSNNAAFGALALLSNTSGFGNTASGVEALRSNTTGTQNMASGIYALYSNTTGGFNTASGRSALFNNTTGGENTASGAAALHANTTGYANTAYGTNALQNNFTGNSNIAIGSYSGSNLTTGSNNIAIGNPGVAAESNTIRIGTTGTQTNTFVAGIRGVTTGLNDAVPVVIDSNGQLGIVSSSKRYKEDVTNMGDVSAKLQALRPVTFRYKQAYADGKKPVQYGLIAEEVAKAFPELAVYNAEGQPETVKYQDLTPLLLNEVQKLQSEKDELQKESAALRARLEKLEAAVNKLSE